LIKAAIIGCGNIAGGYDPVVPSEWSATHAGAYHLCPETELVAVADNNAEALKCFQEKWNIEKGYVDYRNMLKAENIHILSLCLPTDMHYMAFKAAVENDIHAVYCEKPLSLDLSKANEMREMSRGRIVSVNYFRRWNISIESIFNRIRSGKYGNGINAVVRYSKGIFVNGSHFIDLMRWLWGEPKASKYIKTSQEDSIDPGLDFLLEFEDGITAYFINTPNINYVFFDVDILLQNGRIAIFQRGQKLACYNKVREPYYNLFDILSDPHVIETNWRNCTTRAVKEIVHCIKNANQNVSCTMEDGYRALEICVDIVSQSKAK